MRIYTDDFGLTCNAISTLAITKMEEALMWFENRTAERKARGVEGQNKA